MASSALDSSPSTSSYTIRTTTNPKRTVLLLHNETTDSSSADEDLAFCLILLSQDRWDEDSRAGRERCGKFQKKKKKSKKRKIGEVIHRCDVCCRVFASGQALGGHRRAHLNAINNNAKKKKKKKNVVSVLESGERSRLIDLNLPPPDQDCQFEEENEISSFCH